MTNLAKRGPLGLKADPAPKAPYKGVKPVSDKRRKQRASQEGQGGLAYMRAVKTLPCAACGCPGKSEAHHCRDMPPQHYAWLYDRLPGMGQKSADTDTIPLCPECHTDGPSSFHGNRDNFHRLYGADFYMILPTRAQVAAMGGQVDY